MPASNGQRKNLEGHSQVLIAKPVNQGDDSSSGSPPPVFALLNALRRRWKVCFLLGLILGISGAAAAWIFIKPEYIASSYLRIDSDNAPLIFQTADQSQTRSNFDLYKNTQMQLMTTPFVLNAALRDPEVSKLPEIQSKVDPVVWLRNELSIDFPARGEIMQVSLSTESPTACVKIVNAVTSAYMNEVVAEERNERLQRRDSLERVYAEAESKVRNKRSELKSMATALGTGDSESLTVAQQNALQQFGLMQEKLSDVQFQLMQAEGKMRVAQAMDEDRRQRLQEMAERQKERRIPVTSPEVTKMESEVSMLEAELDHLQQSVGERHPRVRRMKNQLQVQNDLLEKARERAEAQQQLEMESGSPTMDRGNRSYDLVALQSEIEVLKNQERMLQEKVDKLEAETRQLGRSSIDVELMRAEIASLEDVLQRVGAESERTSIELKTASRIKLISEAEKATPPDTKKRILRTAALGLMGFMAPFGLILGWDLSRKKIDDGKALSTRLDLPCLGTLPFVRRPLEILSADARQGRRRSEVDLAEAVDSLASMIGHLAEIDDRKVLEISSSVAGEGKSTISCQLAASFARSGKRVALIDFDLRRPSVHQFLGLEPGPGVSEVVTGQVAWSDALQRAEQDNLHVLTAGQTPLNFQQHCADGSVEELFANLRGCFDLVIVDTCPVLAVADARLVGKFCDGCILTLIRDVSRMPLVSQTCQVLRAYGVEVLGGIVVGGRSPAYAYYYQAPVKKTASNKTTRKVSAKSMGPAG